MDLRTFAESVQEFGDLELAVLLCLISKQHSIIYTDDDLIDDLASELSLIASEVFKLSSVILSSEDLQTVEQYAEVILDNEKRSSSLSAQDGEVDRPEYQSPLIGVHMRASSHHRPEQNNLDDRPVVNVVIAKHFNYADHDVQIQTLELIQKGRIYSRTTVHRTPHVFVFLPLIAKSTEHIKLTEHLNDRIFMSHYHSAEDGFANLEELDAISESPGGHSSSSLQKSSGSIQVQAHDRMVTTEIIDRVRELGESATITTEIRRYLQDIVVFLRLERGVDGGVTPQATTAFIALSKYLAPLHGIDYVTPSLIALAAKKIYPHRLIITAPARDRSMQYGSDIETVKRLLRYMTADEIIDTALAKVECPS